MNKKIILPLFLLEAVLCLFLAIFRFSAGSMLIAAMAFPFSQIGTGLRALSLSGTAGNVAAIVLYVLLALTPCAVMFIAGRKRKLVYEDALLCVLSALLFAVLYQMINPGLSPFSALGSDAAKAMAGAMVYAVLCAYIILRLLRLFFESRTQRLQTYMVRLLLIVNAVFVYILFGAGVRELMHSITALQEANAGNEHLLGASYIFVSLGFLVKSIPAACNIAIVFAGIRLLCALLEERYGEKSVAAAAYISTLCKRSLVVMALSNACFHVLQFLFAASLHKVTSDVDIPLFSVLFVLCALLLSRFATENKALKEDNESII